jgi:hypothetical protein
MLDPITSRDGFKKCGARSRNGRGCGVLKPLEAFYPETRNADGRGGICGTCVCAEKKRGYDRDPETILERNRLRRAADPVPGREYAARYSAEHRVATRARDRRYRERQRARAANLARSD